MKRKFHVWFESIGGRGGYPPNIIRMSMNYLRRACTKLNMNHVNNQQEAPKIMNHMFSRGEGNQDFTMSAGPSGEEGESSTFVKMK